MRDIEQLSKSITDRTETTAADFVQIGLQVRYRRIPTRWEIVPTSTSKGGKLRVLPLHKQPGALLGFVLDKGPLNEVLLVPTVEPGTAADKTLDPYRLRTEFLRLHVNDRDATLAFLNAVGLWGIRPNYSTSQKLPSFPVPELNPVDAVADFRHITGGAVPISPGQLERTQKEWRARIELLKRPQELHKQFSVPPGGSYEDQFGFALNSEWYNTVPLHMEWHGKTVQGVIQPVSVIEMLNVTLHLDLLRKMEPQVCQRHDCRTRFTGRRRKYCSDYCAQLESVRAHRGRKNATNKDRKAW